MSNVCVFLNLDEAYAVKEFIANNYSNICGTLNACPELVMAWVKLQEAIQTKESEPNE